MTGENDSGIGKTAAAQTLRKRAEAKVAGDNKPYKNLSASEMSMLFHELRINQAELEMQNEELRKNEQEKTAILDSLVEHVVYQDKEMKILWANRAACASVQMKREDLLGQYCHEIWADRRSPCEDCPVKKARDTQQPQQAEKMTPDGRWWHIEGHQIRDHNDQVIGTTEITLDITDRKRAQEKLRRAKDELEIKVEERTARLVEANAKLRQQFEERQRAQKGLHELKNLLSNTFNAIQDMVVVIDKDFRVTMSNWKGHDYISEKDRLGHPFCYEVFMNRKKPCSPCHATEVFATGEAKQLEGRNPIDGKIRDIRVFPMFDDKGKVVAVIEHLRNITERVSAQKDLRKSVARYRALSEATFEAIFITEKGVCLDVNQRAVDLFGYEYKELIGIFGTDVIAAESKKLVKQNMLAGYEKPYEAIAQKKDGTQFYVEIRGKMMSYRDENVRITVMRDIDIQKRAAEKLRKSEKRYQDLFNSIPVGLYRTTPEGSILDVNPAMLDILGYPDRNGLLQIKSPETYIDIDERERFQHLLEQQGFVHDFTVQLRRHDGRCIWVSINSTIAQDTNGQIKYYEGAMADITDRKEAEEKIHQLSQQLIQAHENERQMISSEMHDTVSQELSVAKMACYIISNEIMICRPTEAQRSKTICEVLQKTKSDISNMSNNLRPPELEEMWLFETIYRFC